MNNNWPSGEMKSRKFICFRSPVDGRGHLRHDWAQMGPSDGLHDDGDRDDNSTRLLSPPLACNSQLDFHLAGAGSRNQWSENEWSEA